MLIKRLKLFNKIDKLVFNEAKKFIRDFGNVHNYNKNHKIIKKLNTKDIELLCKKLPNQITNENLHKKQKHILNGHIEDQFFKESGEYLDKSNLINISEDVWNAIHKAGYFNGRKTKKITREQFNNALNKHFNLDRYKPELDRYIHSDHGNNWLNNIRKHPNYKDKVDYIVHNNKKRVKIDKRLLNQDTVDSKQYINDLNSDKSLNRAKTQVYEGTYLQPGDEFTLVGVNKNNFDKLIKKKEELGLEDFLEDEKVKLANSIGPTKYTSSGEFLKDMKEKYKKDPEIINRNSFRLARQHSSMVENPIDTSKKSIHIGKKTSLGIPEHEAGHAIEINHNPEYYPGIKYYKGPKHIYENPYTDAEILKMELANTTTGRRPQNATEAIRQIGNEAVASSRGVSRLKNKKDKKEAIKNSLNALSTYIVGNESKLLKPNVYI